jgi:ubiquinone/menaquinone biosynthesis C-methylase UbiE
MDLSFLDERQNEAFDQEYHSETELAHKLTLIRRNFPDGPKTILDIGGGNGKFMDSMLNGLPEAEGYVVDVSRSLLAKNCPHPRKHLIQGSLEHLPELVSGRSFDVITINWVLHHLVGPDYRQSIRNTEQALVLATRVLSRSGLILVAENQFDGFGGINAPSHIIYAITHVANRPFVHLARRYFNTAGVGVCFQSKRGWLNLFERCGLRVEHHYEREPWRFSLSKQLLLNCLLLKEWRHGHFALRPNRRSGGSGQDGR